LANRPNRFIPDKNSESERVYRVGVPASIPESDPAMMQLFEQSLRELEAAGIMVLRDIDVPGLCAEWDQEVMRYEFKTAINEFLSQLPSSIPARNLTSLIAYHKEHPELFLKYGQSVFEWVDEISGSLEDPAYLESKAKNIEHAGVQGIDRVLSTYQLDAIVYPENTGSDLAARAGYPLVTVPAGYYASGRPLGITFSGTACSEPLLIQIAYLYETHTKHRIPPVISK
jgi:amidase